MDVSNSSTQLRVVSMIAACADKERYYLMEKQSEPGAGSSVDFTAVVGASASPTLIRSTTSNYHEIYNDKGSGAAMDVKLWRPDPTPGYYILGDYAQGNYHDPVGTSLVVKAPLDDDPNNPLIKAPIGYSLVWNDRGTGIKKDCSIWFPRPPDGYVSIGFIAMPDYDPQPQLRNYACLRLDQVEQSEVGDPGTPFPVRVAEALIWNDSGSGAKKDVTLYKIWGVPNAFVAQPSHAPYAGAVYKLKSLPSDKAVAVA
jgi:hypothetical protein